MEVIKVKHNLYGAARIIARLLSRRNPGGPVPVVTHLVATYFEGRESHVYDLACSWEAFELRFGWNNS